MLPKIKQLTTIYDFRVSSGADTSGEDEDDAGDDDSYDDSFINDRINPTAGSPEAVTSSIDMMAIYRLVWFLSVKLSCPHSVSFVVIRSKICQAFLNRRSLLSQSPIAWQPNSSTGTPNPHSVAVATTSGSGCSSVIHTKGRISGASPYAANFIPETGGESKVRNRKRKLGVRERASLPAINLEELLIDTEEAGKGEQGGESDLFSDDQFYEGIDLDEVEAQATLLLKHKSELSRCEQENVNVVPMEDAQTVGCLGSPSFDLRL